ncbi:amino acid ABC transporter membrane protein 2 (PAAT family) [Stella humosa]|uniref:Amino acid ABC transporter membrane protein 2 (PAAT family) n=1 Tax=Stella humosa TaxID=94 RepID=A0A3N1KPL9_9PROT|nr:amino acid ABC transporter permease [Stella humosa]ROP83703.1 amino acid ABC transporter membrane protein 2 (PAAT family) [Stella humosa]BBK33025.1 amino acid ABC transporter permease [Stella humosa]
MQLILANSTIFLEGLRQTFQLAVATLLCATVVSVLIGMLSVSRRGWARAVAICYVEFFRDIPLLVNMLFVYFGAPLVGVPLSPFAASLISLTLWGGANGAEIVRGGINAVPRHQTASAVALGLKPWEIFRYIILPQALLPILPPFTGLFSNLIQATTLASLVGVTEFFRIGGIIVERTTLQEGHSPAFLIYGFVLLVYFVICSALTALSRRLERNLQRRGGQLARVAVKPQESV